MARHKNELYVTVPSLFRCPISMDVMKSPVSLCTGVTYDRSSITTWLNSGHNTCPATAQILQSTDIIPNLTLRSLIRCWNNSLLVLPDSPAAHNRQSESIAFSPVEQKQILESLKNVVNGNSECYSSSVSVILEFAVFSEENLEIVLNYDGFVTAIVEIFDKFAEIEVLELVILLFEFVIFESREKQKLIVELHRCSLSPFDKILRRGKLNSRISAAKVLESMSMNEETRNKIKQHENLLAELCKFLSSETDRKAIDAALSALIAVTSSKFVKTELIRFGIVRTGAQILSSADQTGPIIEKTMKLLEIVSTCTEGRSAISEDTKCVSAITDKLMKVSDTATEHGIGVIHSVCYLSRDRTARDAAMRSNGLTKVLLVMQSDCSGRVKQMCGELVKVFRVNSKSCLASYETRMSHITPY
ncbi:hypothetical protein DCAR_0416508 [Daucus carota subsp. sativus]|uniref:U-box domain-containing protein n=1 Tax=Daucus carota subsp. sativus TaxID=79200 RepID=A0A165XJ07_DAUCS|nr:PREDICTED: U-box domain-containing protein 28-like [Daucus carota subsp. sativus]WOG97168.1 hypothetical protein DCAR_0416508 [Daucus carota subsp. sativus]